MKTLIVLVVGLLAVGCMTTEKKQKILRDSMVGEYELKEDGNTCKLVLLENNRIEFYDNGKKDYYAFWWSIVGHTKDKNKVYRLHIHSYVKTRSEQGAALQYGLSQRERSPSSLLSRFVLTTYRRLYAGNRIVYRINKDRSITNIAHYNIRWQVNSLISRPINHSKEQQFTIQKTK